MKKHYNNLSIIFFMLSIIILLINLIFFRANNNVITIIGLMFTCLGITFLNLDMRIDDKRGFEMVNENKRKQKYFHMPTRGTKFSAGYDFYSPEEYMVKPNEIVKIWTDVKAYMQSDEFLMLNVRSSMGGKFMLANTIGIIDSDYYGNPDNDGNIGIFLKNISNQTQIIKKDDRIAQGIFVKYLKADNDSYNIKIRKGGYGSTNESNNA